MWMKPAGRTSTLALRKAGSLMLDTASTTSSPITAAGQLFARAAEHFSRAAAGGAQEMVIAPAGLRVRIQAAGHYLLPRLGATLEHLQATPGGEVEFTIHCWDTAASGCPSPLPARWAPYVDGFNCLKGLNGLTTARFRNFYVEWIGLFCSIDMETKTAYCCYADAAHLSMYEVSAPFRSIFGTLLNLHGMHLVHASAIGSADGTLLFAGPPGSGKSTLAIQCLQAGMGYQSDDLCVLRGGAAPRSLSLYNIAKLREDALPRFEPLHPILSHFQEDEEKKAYFYVHRHFPERVLREAPIRAIVLPVVTDEPVTRMERAAPMEAVRGLISWTVKEIPKFDTLGERIMLQALSRLPAYRMRLGRDEESTLNLIRSLLV
jgi:hypothetical protein